MTGHAEGVRRSAVLLASLGTEAAGRVLACLTPAEVQRLGAAMAALGTVSRNELSEAVERLETDAARGSSLGFDTASFLRNTMERAFGPASAVAVGRILGDVDATEIERLRWMDAPSVAQLLRGEHPQVIAAVLAHLPAQHASDVLQGFDSRLRRDTILRLALMESVEPAALRELNEVVRRTLKDGRGRHRAIDAGGPRTVAGILSHLDGALERDAIAALAAHDPVLAQSVEDEMFRFEDLASVPPASLRVLLEQVPRETLALALRGTDDELRSRVLACMPRMAAEQIHEALTDGPRVAQTEVHAQRRAVLKTLRTLIEEGRIHLGGDDVVA